MYKCTCISCGNKWISNASQSVASFNDTVAIDGHLEVCQRCKSTRVVALAVKTWCGEERRVKDRRDVVVA